MNYFSYPCPLSYLLLRFYFPSFNIPQVFPSGRVIAINRDLHVHSIQALCIHLSCSAQPRRTLTVNHYLGSGYFQQALYSALLSHVYAGYLIQGVGSCGLTRRASIGGGWGYVFQECSVGSLGDRLTMYHITVSHWGNKDALKCGSVLSLGDHYYGKCW